MSIRIVTDSTCDLPEAIVEKYGITVAPVHFNQLAFVNALTGWPATIAPLIVSYLYGTWRLARLGGPSVEEFRDGAPAPWSGQRRGF